MHLVKFCLFGLMFCILHIAYNNIHTNKFLFDKMIKLENWVKVIKLYSTLHHGFMQTTCMLKFSQQFRHSYCPHKQVLT